MVEEKNVIFCKVPFYFPSPIIIIVEFDRRLSFSRTRYVEFGMDDALAAHQTSTTSQKPISSKHIDFVSHYTEPLVQAQATHLQPTKLKK